MQPTCRSCRHLTCGQSDFPFPTPLVSLLQFVQLDQRLPMPFRPLLLCSRWSCRLLREMRSSDKGHHQPPQITQRVTADPHTASFPLPVWATCLNTHCCMASRSHLHDIDLSLVCVICSADVFVCWRACTSIGFSKGLGSAKVCVAKPACFSHSARLSFYDLGDLGGSTPSAVAPPTSQGHGLDTDTPPACPDQPPRVRTKGPQNFDLTHCGGTLAMTRKRDSAVGRSRAPRRLFRPTLRWDATRPKRKFTVVGNPALPHDP